MGNAGVINAHDDVTRLGTQLYLDAVERVVGHGAVRHVGRAHVNQRRSVKAQLGARLFGAGEHNPLELVQLTDIAHVRVGTDERLKWGLEQGEVIHDPLEGGTAPDEAARGVVGRLRAI